MSNYDAAPIQPIINGIITIVGGVPVFTGRGISSIVRTAAGALLGDFTLMLDFGLPGNVGLDPAYAKSSLTQRGDPVTGLTTITQQAITYPATAFVRVVTSVASAGVDPPDGLELIVWRTN
jgi:hypothetical protein